MANNCTATYDNTFFQGQITYFCMSHCVAKKNTLFLLSEIVFKRTFIIVLGFLLLLLQMKNPKGSAFFPQGVTDVAS